MISCGAKLCMRHESSWRLPLSRTAGSSALWSTSTQEAMLEYLTEKFSWVEAKSDTYKEMSGLYKTVILPSDKLIFLSSFIWVKINLLFVRLEPKKYISINEPFSCRFEQESSEIGQNAWQAFQLRSFQKSSFPVTTSNPTGGYMNFWGPFKQII